MNRVEQLEKLLKLSQEACATMREFADAMAPTCIRNWLKDNEAEQAHLEVADVDEDEYERLTRALENQRIRIIDLEKSSNAQAGVRVLLADSARLCTIVAEQAKRIEELEARDEHH